MYAYALEVPEFANGGIGAYDGNFLHLDVRGHAARWARVRGQYVGIDNLVVTTCLDGQERSDGAFGLAREGTSVGWANRGDLRRGFEPSVAGIRKCLASPTGFEPVLPP